MNRTRRLLTAPALAIALALLAALLPAPRSLAQPVTSDGWAEKSAGLEFYIEVPMIDNKDIKNYGVGGNITAESIINSVRYASGNDKVNHVVFMMDTGGGSLYHAEAMEDIIEKHHDNTEFHIVVQNAISAGIWTAFSCDTIFMCKAGTLGGATAYYQVSDQEVVAAPDIPWIAANLEFTAKRNGYPPQLIAPLMLMKSELHYWNDEDGKKVLSNDPPADRKAVKRYRHLDQSNTVLTLTTNDAIEIGIAKPIDDFDATLVGKQLGLPGWTRGNRYGQCIDQIGWIYNTTRVMEDAWVSHQLDLPSFPVTRTNRENRAIVKMLDDREKYADVVAALRMINTALNELPDVHPERHIYLPGDNSTTIVPDVERWAEDARQAKSLAGRINAGARRLAKAYEALGQDTGQLEEIEGPLQEIIDHVNGIANKGNVQYWHSEID